MSDTKLGEIVSPILEKLELPPRYRGGFDAFTGESISGWLVDTTKPQEVLELDVVIERIKFPTVMTGGDRADIAMYLPSCRCKFCISMRDMPLDKLEALALRLQSFDEQQMLLPVALEIGIPGGPKLPLSPNVPSRNSLAAAIGEILQLDETLAPISGLEQLMSGPRYRGGLDGFMDDQFSGWLVDLKHPSEAIEIEGAIEGIDFFQGTTGKPRYDLEQYLPGNHCGFSIKMYEQPLDRLRDILQQLESLDEKNCGEALDLQIKIVGGPALPLGASQVNRETFRNALAGLIAKLDEEVSGDVSLEIPAKDRLASSIDVFNPLHIAGLFWDRLHPNLALSLEVRRNGRCVHRGNVVGQKPVELTVADLELSPKDISEIAASGHVDLDLLIAGNAVLEKRFMVEVSADGSFGVLLNHLSLQRISGQVMFAPQFAESTEILLRRGDQILDCFATDPQDRSFDIELSGAAQDNVTAPLSLGPDDVKDTAEQRIPLCFASEPAIIDLDIKGDRIIGQVRDFGGDAEIGVEILIDGQAIAIEVLRPPVDQGDIDRPFAVPVSARCREGHSHQVAARLVGSATVYPDNPLMFRADYPEQVALIRVEAMPDGHIEGWAVMPWQPDVSPRVRLLQNDSEVCWTVANRFHPMLAENGLVPEHRGFEFAPGEAKAVEYVLRFEDQDGAIIKDVALVMPVGKGNFTIEAAGHSRSGLCIALPDPFANAATREETRTLLMGAAEAVQAGEEEVTVAFPGSFRGGAGVGCSVKDLLNDLIGSKNAQTLARARFVVVPEAPVDTTASGGQKSALALDIWVRANRFSRVVATSRGGMLAYCAASRRQGLLPGTEIVLLAEAFTIPDRLAADQLFDEPGLLFDEALERLAIKASDRILSANLQVAEAIRQIAPNDVPRLELVRIGLGELPRLPAVSVDQDIVDWLVFVGPLRAQNGLIHVCNALDRLTGRMTAERRKTIGIAFVGPSDWLRGKDCAAYLRDRSRKWPFRLRLLTDLDWQSNARVLAPLGGKGVLLVTPQLEGTVWDTLARTLGLRPLRRGPERDDNAWALAEDIVATLDGAEASTAEVTDVPTLASLLRASVPAPARTTQSPQPLPKVTICVTHFNRPALLRQTLASIVANEYPDLEIIVVDDGSTLPGVSEELAEIETWLANHNGRIVHQKNRYLGAARNTAARNATGDMLIFMDDDNLATPGMIRSFLDFHLNTGAEIITARFGLFDGTDAIDPQRDVPRQIGIPLTPDMALGVISNCFGDANMMITRSVFDRIGGFTEDYGRGHEDWELFAQASTLGIRHELVNIPLFWYRVAPTSMLRNRESKASDLLRNIRAYASTLSPEIFRIVQLGQGLTERWDRPSVHGLLPARSGLATINRLAWGRVAVIMRTKDRPLLLRRAIDSVLHQTYQDWVLVIVNDGGDSAPIEKLLEQRRNRLQGRFLLINNPKSTGMENASNAGVTHSASEFLVVHDDDDSWTPRFLERCVNHLDSVSPEVAGVVTQATVIIEEIAGNEVVERDRYPFKQLEALALTNLSSENEFPPICFLFRRSVMELVGMFNGELPVLGDWDFHLRVVQRYQVDVLRESLANYHHRVVGAGGGYDNTVVAMKDTHRIQRTKYINRYLRAALRSGDLSEGEFLYHGEIRRNQIERFDDLKNHLFWLEKLLNDQRSHTNYLEELIKKTSGN
ncbi:glycosyltransferase family 2 protein [Solidesulfovibrio alcoholivorans]|uniref:glycosyltransferase family 2 protein n=1 Tax=Solidesulfovibrio alcoholivorans TaxID=81406 RepID=UPI0006936C9B|nr:glycosyltransferase [Solidesulfovibrio alcoholivorans]